MTNIWSHLYLLIGQKALDVNFKGVGSWDTYFDSTTQIIELGMKEMYIRISVATFVIQFDKKPA